MEIDVVKNTVPEQSRPPAEPKAEEAERLLRAAPAATVLVVDDDEGIRSAVAEILEGFGYRVAVAADGVEAAELLEVGLEPSAIVLDMMMPRMDGWTFLEKLRASERFHGVPVVVASAMVERPPRGADALLHKPFNVGELQRAVTRLTSH